MFEEFEAPTIRDTADEDPTVFKDKAWYMRLRALQMQAESELRAMWIEMNVENGTMTPAGEWVQSEEAGSSSLE